MDTRDRSDETDETAEHRNETAEHRNETAEHRNETAELRDDTAGAAERDGDRRRGGDPERHRRRDPGGDSIVDLAQRPIVKAWTAYLTLLLALVAVGFGLFGIFSDAVGEGIVDADGGIAGVDAAFEAAFSVPITATPYLAILLAVFVGAFLGWRLERDRSTTYVTAGICTGVATVVFWTLAALFGTIPLAVSIDIGALLVNALLAGITAGIVAAGGVWATRTRAPIGLTAIQRDTRSEP